MKVVLTYVFRQYLLTEHCTLQSWDPLRNNKDTVTFSQESGEPFASATNSLFGSKEESVTCQICPPY